MTNLRDTDRFTGASQGALSLGGQPIDKMLEQVNAYIAPCSESDSTAFDICTFS